MKDQLKKILNLIKFKKSSSMKNKKVRINIQSITDSEDKTFSPVSYKISPVQCKIPMTSGLAELLKKSPKSENNLPKSENSSTCSEETSLNVRPELKKTLNIKPEPTGISRRLSQTRKTKKVNWIYEP